ncbi:hypothetical protein P171DRAFT_227936 [Karstenula rhodostoma CBS 690.94]|uniref:Mid2 domain-containing protein n=1 Tax=Karstenula rhodostoma CBS 690.94 TaxID=1392251 RepID=A0A9P4UD95_9PLEO|nr:hypothetical protein P171DRAFT_227936 [Karstenula rhodostoma CBS 690.94]
MSAFIGPPIDLVSSVLGDVTEFMVDSTGTSTRKIDKNHVDLTSTPVALTVGPTPTSTQLVRSVVTLDRTRADETPAPITVIQTVIKSRGTSSSFRAIGTTLSTSASSNTPTAASPSPSAQSSAPVVVHAGLSTGAKAGIGVGAALGVLLVAIAAFYIGFRWRRRSVLAPLVEHNVVHEIDGKYVEGAQDLQPPEKFPAWVQRDASLDVDEWMPHKAHGMVR